MGCQGESLWLHLDIIKSLAAMCHEVFVGGTVQYAYTTIPTYPRWALTLLSTITCNTFLSPTSTKPRAGFLCFLHIDSKLWSTLRMYLAKYPLPFTCLSSWVFTELHLHGI